MLADTLTWLADTLTDAGVPADWDPARLPVPGAWLAAEELRPATLGGARAIRCKVHLVVPDHGTTQALADLEALLEAALNVIEPDGPIELDGYVRSPQGNLPAFTIPTTVYTD